MSNNLYKNALINGHTYSRQPLAAGQVFSDQMSIKSGHSVYEHDVRGEKIPKILSLEERNEKYLSVNGIGKRVTGGPIGCNYTKIIKFIDLASLREIPNSNGESFQVIDENGNPLTNFIDPTDYPVSTTKLSDGYTICLFSNDNSTPISINYGWSFNPLAGIVHFSSDFKPGSVNWENEGFGEPLLEGFIYIGKSSTDNISKVSSDIKVTQNNLEYTIGQLLAIQPVRFSTDQMDLIGSPYPKELMNISSNEYVYFQRLSFTVQGYCFELTALDKDETIITEMRHLPTGDTKIFMDLPWEINYNKPIIGWNYQNGNTSGKKYPVLGKYSFIATSFIKNNGERIELKPIINCDVEGYEKIVENDYTYITDYENGWMVPSQDGILEGDSDNVQADSSVNVNININ